MAGRPRLSHALTRQWKEPPMSTTSQGFTAIQAFDYRPGITTREALSDNPAVRGHALSINQGFPYPATSAAFHHGHQGEMRQHIQRNTGGDLTRREREVLRLVASGATDQS